MRTTPDWEKERFEVHLDYDGVCEPSMYPAKFSGSYDECRYWIRKNDRKFTKGKWSLVIVDTQSGRLVSFVVPV